MTLRTFTPPAGIYDPGQLAAQIDIALLREGTSIRGDGANILVDIPNWTAADDATVTSVISGYVFDANWNSATLTNLANITATLRQWATDASNEATAWPTQTTAQQNAAMTTTFNRLSAMFNRMADLLTFLGRTNG